jgi:hypothetical protein
LNDRDQLATSPWSNWLAPPDAEVVWGRRFMVVPAARQSYPNLLSSEKGGCAFRFGHFSDVASRTDHVGSWE